MDIITKFLFITRMEINKWNINTWLNWYICQWDLYIDSVDNIKSQLLIFISEEEETIYYKKSNDISYYNYRKICQLVIYNYIRLLFL